MGRNYKQNYQIQFNLRKDTDTSFLEEFVKQCRKPIGFIDNLLEFAGFEALRERLFIHRLNDYERAQYCAVRDVLKQRLGEQAEYERLAAANNQRLESYLKSTRVAG